MIVSKIVSILLFVGLLAVFSACLEQGDRAVKIENYGQRRVVCVKIQDSFPDSLVKLEFNDGRNLSAIYWQRNAVFGYLFDFRSGKLFIDAPSSIFFKEPSDFYSNLERNIDIQKIKDSLTPEILREFLAAIEKAAPKIDQKFLGPAFLASLEKAKKMINEIDLKLWHQAVDLEKNKIHALGLEYCLKKIQAEKLLSNINFSLTYKQIIAKQLESQKQFVVCLGENHPEDVDKVEAVRLMTELKSLGFNYLLLESVLASDQKILDDYEPNCPFKREFFLEYFNKNGWGPQSVNLGGRGSYPYLEIIDAAKNLDFKIIGIGNHQRDRHIEFLRNNYWMALNVVDVLKNDPAAKIIVFAGATHVFPNYIPNSDVVLEGYLMRQDIPDIIKKLTGTKSITFECIGGLKDMEFRKYLDPEKVLEKHIENFGWAQKRFFIPVPPEISTLSPEGEYYYIHLPQY